MSDQWGPTPEQDLSNDLRYSAGANRIVDRQSAVQIEAHCENPDGLKGWLLNLWPVTRMRIGETRDWIRHFRNTNEPPTPLGDMFKQAIALPLAR